MTATSAFSFGVVCEAAADQRTACDLAERILLENVDWLQPSLLAWHGFDTATKFLAWKSVMAEARNRGLRKHGKFHGASGKYDELRATLALRLFKLLDEPPDAVLLVRDSDVVDERIPSLRRALDASTWKSRVVLATPHPKRECWILAGFEPVTEAEEHALHEVNKLLGFDPRLQAERLTAKGSKSKKNAKAVLDKLAPESSRQEAFMQKTNLETLAERGQGSLLAAYLDEVSQILVPLLSGDTSQ